MSDDNFADAPISIGEIRAAKTNDASDITPREALIELLRGIDSGRYPIDILVCGFSWKDPQTGKAMCNYTASSIIEGRLELVGLASHTLHRLNKNIRDE